MKSLHLNLLDLQIVFLLLLSTGSFQIFLKAVNADVNDDEFIPNILVDLNKSVNFTSPGSHSTNDNDDSDGSFTNHFKDKCQENHYDVDCQIFYVDMDNSVVHYKPKGSESKGQLSSYELIWSASFVFLLLGLRRNRQSGARNSRKLNPMYIYSLVLATSNLRSVMAVPQSSFYAFGTSAGDDKLPEGDDRTEQLILSESFVFFGTSYNHIYVNSNGGIAFNESWSSATPAQFPLPLPIIAPFWSDSDISCGDGNVYYRQTTDDSIRTRAANDIQQKVFLSDTFYPSVAVVVTWDHIPSYPCLNNIENNTNTFQLVLATDGNRSFALFLYLDDGIQWSLAPFANLHAQVGYNAGDNVNYFSVTGSLTPDIVNIETTSNIFIAGLYIFQVHPTAVDICPPSQSEGCINGVSLIVCTIMQDSQEDLPQPCSELLQKYKQT